MRGNHTGELLAIDRFTTGPVPFRKVSTLKHEAWDNAMESRPLVSESVLTRRELPEIFGCLWHYIVKEFKLDAAGRLVIDIDVKLSENVRWIVRRKIK